MVERAELNAAVCVGTKSGMLIERAPLTPILEWMKHDFHLVMSQAASISLIYF